MSRHTSRTTNYHYLIPYRPILHSNLSTCKRLTADTEACQERKGSFCLRERIEYEIQHPRDQPLSLSLSHSTIRSLTCCLPPLFFSGQKKLRNDNDKNLLETENVNDKGNITHAKLQICLWVFEVEACTESEMNGIRIQTVQHWQILDSMAI